MQKTAVKNCSALFGKSNGQTRKFRPPYTINVKAQRIWQELLAEQTYLHGIREGV